MTHRKPYTTIIQADGFPDERREDNYKSTLQTVAAAEIVQNEKPSCLFSACQAEQTAKQTELAKMCDISYHGVMLSVLMQEKL